MLAVTFSGWIEAFPTRTETATEVAKALLKEIIPRFGFPGSLERDNGPAFVSQVTKGIMSALDIKRDFALSLETPTIRESKEIQSDLEIGLTQVMSRNSRILD